MNLKTLICLIVFIAIQIHTGMAEKAKGKPGPKKPVTYKPRLQNSKFENPDSIRDRYRDAIKKPPMMERWKNRHRLPYNDNWMDYCDPRHCGAYHKTACGLHRKKMKFKWFQSGCHIILNNKCASYRGSLLYDMVDPKFCVAYVMFLRTNCEPCTDSTEDPVCGVSDADQHVVLFRNRCALEEANCRSETLNDYSEVPLHTCALSSQNTASTEIMGDLTSLLDTSVGSRRPVRRRTECKYCTTPSRVPVCGMSIVDQHTERFPNHCALEKANCDPDTFEEFIEVEANLCTLMELREKGINLKPSFDLVDRNNVDLPF